MTKLPVELFATFGVGLGVGLLLHKYALAASSKDAITSTKGLSIEDQQDEVRRLVRPNILKLTPYRCARDDYSEGTLLDANENSLGPPLHDDHLLRDEGLERYPCPYQIDLKTAVANLRYSLSPFPPLEDKHVFLGVGSDEVIDLMIRIACIPRVDSILITPPTYGMYRVCADIHDVNIIESPLYNGFVVVDEAYIDFTGSSESSLAPLVTKYRRLVVTQTLSKGFGLAGIRLGIAFGDPELIQILSNVKAPYNINKLSSKVALDALANVDRLHANVRVILDEKQKVIDALQASPYVKAVYASDSNFVLFECANAYQVYRKMAENGVVIRYRGNQHLLNDCLRATIGSPEENHRMLTMFASVSAEVQQA
ncbi:hypothetical protein DYB25_011559 [Aphanomyces astaci]|uniref:histidinol-phosphate transaminase n=1 Tax=Aphanomyces astaci TaxID=112090 RepID=A0A397EFD1_APHAT|nr:hypothetical protein DYB36_004804 [Aphanomyces astaci]RHY21119.1 hypothetical protein DYB25_011559 [Aphanomyces astaci]RHY70720.1 hypothetical protein DYB34_001715 [Aphanomyces astaci]RHY81577.1 hypothetical protein DYB31_010103 [Aphanomyces astaci]RHZ40773.1 hypothetical protein DYB26_001151 [Aphanomyces astaci]